MHCSTVTKGCDTRSGSAEQISFRRDRKTVTDGGRWRLRADCSRHEQRKSSVTVGCGWQLVMRTSCNVVADEPRYLPPSKPCLQPEQSMKAQTRGDNCTRDIELQTCRSVLQFSANAANAGAEWCGSTLTRKKLGLA